MTCVCPGSISQSVWEKTQRHPCYSAEAHSKYARIHLPVAPRCNIQCNYCNRKFDCVNESRPGVTSEVLTPELAREKFVWVREKVEDLSVVGIAGPGDALADWQATKQTIKAIQAIAPEVVFCLSTNGLRLPDYAAEMVELGIHHVTVTLNALDSEIGAKIYQFITYQGRRYEGKAAAEILLQNQLAGIRYLTGHGILVKVNMVMIKGINDHHIPEVVKKVKELGVFVTNIMPLIPATGSNFENFPQTSMKEVNELRNLCQLDLPQMRHCQQCRADAIGRLHEDRSQEFRMANRTGETKKVYNPVRKQYRIAVTSKYNKLVDQHFGHATGFTIYQGDGYTFQPMEQRSASKYCSGMADCEEGENRRDQTIDALQDCDAVLTMRIGPHAKDKLSCRGVTAIEYCDSVENGLRYAVEVLIKQEATEYERGIASTKRTAN
ncbi:nitrogenase cofactor biosynthesis protein NifB [Propionispora vibrioides]|uniref:FeMo cofactor biosynthesis protein NifB n=1 Tax=Propionispora vibrioides TaxID=112903 RepID=A0A1H8WLJ1_9FIRM|nr:nitrogenase cofactor biosynthesis protein NifB [Propionispora vibrioides]SEP27958.1 nitrogen fixation protein NifB [Propionispora vibrioides]